MSLTKKTKATCRKSNYLKPKECCVHVTAALDQHLAIPIQGNFTQTEVFGAVVGMAAMNQSIHSITGVLEHVPCETSPRYHLKKLDMGELEEKNTTILTYMADRILKPRDAYQFLLPLA